MKKRLIHLVVLGLTALIGVAQASTVTIVDDGVSNIGAPGTFYWAITNTPAGGTIDFAIPGAGPHYLIIPPGGFPIVYRKGNLTIDGYTQPGASANSNPITAANNAVMKIVIDGRNGNRRNMQIKSFGTTVISDPPIDNSYMAGTGEASGLTGLGESALLGIYRSTNVNVRGLAFLGKATTVGNDRSKGIVIEMDYDGVTTVLPRYGYTSGSSDGCHINGCWFGINPATPTVASSALDQAFRVCVTSYRHTDGITLGRPQLINADLTIGVKKGSLNPRAEFNVMAGVGGFLSTDSLGLRVSGNFISVLPDGTPFNFLADSLFPTQWRGGWFDVGCRQDDELGRPMVIGTDGDGVNDADEGNLFGPLARNGANQQSMFGFFETKRNAFIVAGNRFGIGLTATVWPNNDFYISTFRMDSFQSSQVRFGSDFNGVSDALEANVIYNNNVFATQYPAPALSVAPSLFRVMDNIAGTDAWFSFRGNKSVNCFPIYNPNHTTADDYTNSWNTYFPDVDNKVPVLSASTVSLLNGTFNAPVNGANTCVVDVYVPDTDGQVNGAAFDYPFFGGLAGEGFVQGNTHLGSFLDNGPYDSNPAVGAFSFNIAGLGLAGGTKVTVAVTYSKWALPVLATPVVSGGNVALSWTGSNGGPYTGGLPGASSGFGVQSASSITGPWTTTFSAANNIVLPAAGSTGFYRIVAPISGMTTLCAIPVVLP